LMALTAARYASGNVGYAIATTAIRASDDSRRNGRAHTSTSSRLPLVDRRVAHSKYRFAWPIFPTARAAGTTPCDEFVARSATSAPEMLVRSRCVSCTATSGAVI
jgi:hypothetical protein